MPDRLRKGLYEALVTEALSSRLETIDPAYDLQRRKLDRAEAADRLALHVSRVLERALAGVSDSDRVAIGIELVRALVERIDASIEQSDSLRERPETSAEILNAILGRRPDGESDVLESPLTPLLDTTLLTNAPREPHIGAQLSAEIVSANRIDVIMAFIRRSGIRRLLDALRRHCERTDHAAPLRVLTTTYTQSTERRALDDLQQIGATVRVSYDTSSTRLHAKAWLFHRHSGFSTAYIGSSNLTHSAQHNGLEWNVRVSGARNPDVIRKMSSVFDSYWENGDFRPYDADEFDQETERVEKAGPTVILSPIELRLEPFQERLLEQITLARQQGHHRNLLVSATGTGKTVMAAVDYARLRSALPRSRLLFVAHRKEILEQSLHTFQYALREPAFGEQWVGTHRPRMFEHVFASIQILNATGYTHLDPEHFDVVIIDEFHHAAAKSYEKLLKHLQPRQLLGLTATPERSDGTSVLQWFDDRIAADLRLWDAIDQHRLSPFVYWGIHDGLDLRKVPWRRGQGYDVDGLTNLYTADDAWARLVIKEVCDRIDDPHSMRALGFCVSVEHARFMSRQFNRAGINAVAVWGDSPQGEREAALNALADGTVRILFSVDLFNEGIDLPMVDTLLLLRPTDSPVLFLQQLGRGLRRAHGKVACAVLDFVGQHRKEFRFDRRLGALLPGTRKDLEWQIKQGFPYLPAGCQMELDAVASDIILTNLRNALPGRWAQKCSELKALADAGHPANLQTYLEHTGMALPDVYANNKSWSDLLEGAGLTTQPTGVHEKALRRAIGRLLHVDDNVRIEYWRLLLKREQPPELNAINEHDQRLIRTLVASVADQVLSRTTPLHDALTILWEHPQVRAELVEVLTLLGEQITHVHRPVTSHPDVPLQIHGRYSRIEIQTAFGIGNAARAGPWQSGVLWSPDAACDLLAFTLDKSSGGFSPTTRYRDYAISRELIHWESQSATRADSPTGRRYQEHATQGSSVMLFARANTTERSFWFLGPAIYVSHESEQPMAIVWRLQHDLPGDLYASFAAAVA